MNTHVVSWQVEYLAFLGVVLLCGRIDSCSFSLFSLGALSGVHCSVSCSSGGG